MKASEAIRAIIEAERKIPGKPALTLPIDTVLITAKRDLILVTYEDLEKALIAVGE